MKKQLLSLLVLCLMLSWLCGCGASDSPEANQPAQDDSVQTVQSVDAAALVRDISTVQYFTQEAVAEEDVQRILEAGVQSPSAMNGQPWHFSAVSDASVLQQIADGMGGGMSGASTEAAASAEASAEMPSGESANPPAAANGASSAPNKAGIADAPLAIIISAKEGSEFDAGLACQNMSVEAQLLGYGTKILSSTTMVLNGAKQAEYKEILGIPEDMSAVAVLLVGFEDEAAAAENGVDGVASATARNPMDSVVTYVRAD